MAGLLRRWFKSSLDIELESPGPYESGDYLTGVIHLNVTQKVRDFKGVEVKWRGVSAYQVVHYCGNVYVTYHDKEVIFEHTVILYPPDLVAENECQEWISWDSPIQCDVLPAGQYIIRIPAFKIPRRVPPSVDNNSFVQGGGSARVTYHVTADIPSSDIILDHHWKDKCKFGVLGSPPIPFSSSESLSWDADQHMQLSLRSGDLYLSGDFEHPYLVVGADNTLTVRLSSETSTTVTKLTATVKSVLYAPSQTAVNAKWKKLVGKFEMAALREGNDNEWFMTAFHIPAEFLPSFENSILKLHYTIKFKAHRTSSTRPARFKCVDIPAGRVTQVP